MFDTFSLFLPVRFDALPFSITATTALPTPTRRSRSQQKVSEALLKCGRWEWCNRAFKRDRNNRIGWWLVVRGGGCGGASGGYIWHIFLPRSAGSREWLPSPWIWMLCVMLSSVWLQLPRRWCHPEEFVRILEKETKIARVSLITLPVGKHLTTPWRWILWQITISVKKKSSSLFGLLNSVNV